MGIEMSDRPKTPEMGIEIVGNTERHTYKYVCVSKAIFVIIIERLYH